MRAPLERKLRKRLHKEIAYAQDTIVEVLYRFFPNCVIHGGTAVWRGFGSNRFSEDIDLYLEKNAERINAFFEELRRMGFLILKKRIKENSLFSKVKLGNAEIRIEAIFKRVKGAIMEYETVDGRTVNVFSLGEERIIKEKVRAYLKRRKVRDLYDVFFLLRFVKDKSGVEKDIRELVENFEKPVDEGELRNIIIAGAIPTAGQILDYIQGWLK